jgi:competence protein ComEC
LFFIAGIIVQWRMNLPLAGICIPVGVAIVCLVLSFVPAVRRPYRFRFLFGTGLCCLLFASAVGMTKMSQKQSDWDMPAESYRYQAIIIDEPVDKPKTRMCKIRITAAEASIHSAVAGKEAVIYLPKDSLSRTLVAGDGLRFYGTLESAAPYLKKQSVAASGFVRANRWAVYSGSASPFSIRLKALAVRRALLQRLQQIVPDPSACSIAAALMFGYRNEVDDALMQSFRNIGAAHILAISGTHFVILFGMCYFLLSLIINNSRKGKRLKQGILLPLAWAFAFLTGFSPSVVRAVLMLTVWGIGEMLAYRAFTLNTVAATAFLMLWFHPLYLFDVGFQLSFMAVISIVLLNPYLMAGYESRNPALNYLWGLICVSISAQAGVTPLSAFYFHQIPVLFLLANICLLPLASVLLGLIPVSLLLHALFGGIPGLLYPLNRALAVFISMVRHLDDFSYINIQNVSMNEWDTVVFSLAILLLILLWIKKRGIYLCLLLLLMVFQVMYRFV